MEMWLLIVQGWRISGTGSIMGFQIQPSSNPAHWNLISILYLILLITCYNWQNVCVLKNRNWLTPKLLTETNHTYDKPEKLCMLTTWVQQLASTHIVLIFMITLIHTWHINTTEKENDWKKYVYISNKKTSVMWIVNLLQHK